MNKNLFYLLLLLLLNHCHSEGGDVECTGDDNEECTEKTSSNPLKKCEIKESKCIEVPKTCTEAALLESMVDVECSDLNVDGTICVNGDNGCLIADECDKVTSGATAEICATFLVDDYKKKCVFVEADTENNVKAHCKSESIACTEAGDSLNQDKCSERSVSGEYCYFDGSSCKKATNCEEISLSSGETTDLCGFFDSDQGKCEPSGTTCEFKYFCNLAPKEDTHDCNYFALQTENNVCVLKIGSETLKCEEVTSEEARIRNLCSGKENAQCGILVDGKILVECEWEGEGDTGACQFKEKYAKCQSAKDLLKATNDQCSPLETETYQECIKGEKGCEIKTRACKDNIAGPTEEICDNLTPSTGNKCYFDGEKCEEANSCTNVQETKITDNTKLTTLCAKFKEAEKECIPNDKKCKLKEKDEPGTGDEDGKDTTKESVKDSDSGNTEEKDTTKESVKDSDSGNTETKDTTKESVKDSNGAETETVGTDGKADKENENDQDGNSSWNLAFSLSILFSLLAI